MCLIKTGATGAMCKKCPSCGLNNRLNNDSGCVAMKGIAQVDRFYAVQNHYDKNAANKNMIAPQSMESK